MNFLKMCGLGNDYICALGEEQWLIDAPKRAVQLCNRHYGIGADGLILVLPSENADFKMRLYNADGSEASMCGNGICCLAKFVFEQHLTSKTTLKIETNSGLREVFMKISEHQIVKLLVDMGVPQMPADGSEEVLHIEETPIRYTPISMGNPHAVVWKENLQELPIEKLGAAMERHPRFPNRTNIEFCRYISPKEIEVRVWERGVGETFACGTGACAAAAVAILRKNTENTVKVNFPGGYLWVFQDKKTNHVYLEGNVQTIFEGVVKNVFHQ